MCVDNSPGSKAHVDNVDHVQLLKRVCITNLRGEVTASYKLTTVHVVNLTGYMFTTDLVVNIQHDCIRVNATDKVVSDEKTTAVYFCGFATSHILPLQHLLKTVC